MNRIRAATLVVATAIGLLSSVDVWADRGGLHGGWHGGGGFHHFRGHEHHDWHGGVGIYLGPTFFWPGYGVPFNDPLYESPAPAVIEPPPVYIERGDGNPPPAQGNLWYYCDSAGAYYPYVKQCPSGWRAVAPQQR